MIKSLEVQENETRILPETFLLGGSAEVTVGITLDYAEAHERAIANGGKANWEVLSDYS